MDLSNAKVLVANQAFKPGEIVTLKSGGDIPMVVALTTQTKDGLLVRVAWMYEGDMRIIEIPAPAFVHWSDRGISQDFSAKVGQT